jgi:choloylglycine hydrolase
MKFQPLGNGSGMLGLPGDFTSPSRFVRAALFSQSLVHIQNEFDALDAAFHLLHLFDIPIGVVGERTDETISYELTQWTSVTDLHNKRFFFTTYSNPQIRMIDLMSMHQDGSELVVIPMESVGEVEDITPHAGESV